MTLLTDGRNPQSSRIYRHVLLKTLRLLPRSPADCRTAPAQLDRHELDAMAKEQGRGLCLRSGPLSWLVRDAPEYEERKKRSTFVPPSISIKDVHAAVPRHLFEKNTAKGLFYVGRHVAFSLLFYLFAIRIDYTVWNVSAALHWGPFGRSVLCWSMWALYWFWQSVAFAGMWTLGQYG